MARRFNHLYGREPGFEEAVTAAIKKMGKKQARIYADNRRKYQEQGDESAWKRPARWFRTSRTSRSATKSG